MFASNLNNLRLASGLTQQEVAVKLNISRATYMTLETGKKSPTLDQLKILSKLFEVGTAELISDKSIESSSTKNDVHDIREHDNDIAPRDTPIPNTEKLREVLLYVLQKVGAKPNVGETVLYKLLYFIDFDYYEKYGKSITGLTYVRNTYGPTPKSQTFNGVITAMKEASELDVVETRFFKHTQKKYLPVVQPKLKELSAHELAHIDEELARLGDKTATELSNLSHRDMPWIATGDKKPIEYQLAMYRTTETSVKEPEDEL
jgi:transcriptional regulator with XRE-family HTH domain